MKRLPRHVCLEKEKKITQCGLSLGHEEGSLLSGEIIQ